PAPARRLFYAFVRVRNVAKSSGLSGRDAAVAADALPIASAHRPASALPLADLRRVGVGRARDAVLNRARLAAVVVGPAALVAVAAEDALAGGAVRIREADR